MLLSTVLTVNRIAVITVSIISLGFYFWDCLPRNSNKKPSLADACVILLGSNGVVAGLFLSSLYLDDEFIQNIPSDIPSFYIPIGGIAIAWVSVEAIIKNLKNAPTSEEEGISSSSDSDE